MTSRQPRGIDAISEEEANLYFDYMVAGAERARGRHGFRVPTFVLIPWVENGFAVLRTNTLANKYGVSRRTMWRTISGCVRDGIIKVIGYTDEGKAMYAPCLEIVDEWRAKNTGLANGEE